MRAARVSESSCQKRYKFMRSSDILIVDDEIGIRDLLSEILQDEGYSVALAENAEEARKLRHQARPAMVLLDIWMPDCDGITLLKEWSKNGQLNMPVVMMSGHANIDTAVEATKIGALDFLEKPISLQKLLSAVENALKHGAAQIETGPVFDKLGNSAAIQEMNREVEAAAKRTSPVFLTGEAGSPFETVARYFHKNGTPWVIPAKAEYLADMPMELLKKAEGGVLYAGDIARYGRNIRDGIAFIAGKAERCRVRLVAAYGRPAGSDGGGEEKAAGFPPDSVVRIPPLRMQHEDIPFLIQGIACNVAESQKITPAAFGEDALAVLSRYDWPGNFEQLQNVVTTLLLEADGQEIGIGAASSALGRGAPDDGAGHMACGFDFNLPLRELREAVERRYFEYHIAQEGQNMSQVAQKVGLERTHLYRKLKQLGIGVSRRAGEKTEE